MTHRIDTNQKGRQRRPRGAGVGGGPPPKQFPYRQMGLRSQIRSDSSDRGQQGPQSGLGLLGDSRVATNIRVFFSTRIGSALPDTG
ncbi:hypothetical protein WA026_011548 [Henosepilachna vigintioctopunctata]|uniref:Uncharacterized protein n=1 Tax=Henosepilachna vigintioctopunctata TaxID=420089 RepID=A0AAW1TS58_9CUCU